MPAFPRSSRVTPRNQHGMFFECILVLLFPALQQCGLLGSWFFQPEPKNMQNQKLTPFVEPLFFFLPLPVNTITQLRTAVPLKSNHKLSLWQAFSKYAEHCNMQVEIISLKVYSMFNITIIGCPSNSVSIHIYSKCILTTPFNTISLSVSPDG